MTNEASPSNRTLMCPELCKRSAGQTATGGTLAHATFPRKSFKFDDKLSDNDNDNRLWSETDDWLDRQLEAGTEIGQKVSKLIAQLKGLTDHEREREVPLELLATFRLTPSSDKDDELSRKTTYHDLARRSFRR